MGKSSIETVMLNNFVYQLVRFVYQLLQGKINSLIFLFVCLFIFRLQTDWKPFRGEALPMDKGMLSFLFSFYKQQQQQQKARDLFRYYNFQMKCPLKM